MSTRLLFATGLTLILGSSVFGDHSPFHPRTDRAWVMKDGNFATILEITDHNEAANTFTATAKTWRKIHTGQFREQSQKRITFDRGRILTPDGDRIPFDATGRQNSSGRRFRMKGYFHTGSGGSNGDDRIVIRITRILDKKARALRIKRLREQLAKAFKVKNLKLIEKIIRDLIEPCDDPADDDVLEEGNADPNV